MQTDLTFKKYFIVATYNVISLNICIAITITNIYNIYKNLF